MGTCGLDHGLNWTRCCVQIIEFQSYFIAHVALLSGDFLSFYSFELILLKSGRVRRQKDLFCHSSAVTKATLVMCREAVGDTARESDIRWRCFRSAVVIVVSQLVDGCSLFPSLCPFTQPCFTFSCDRQQHPLSRTNALCIQ